MIALIARRPLALAISEHGGFAPHLVASTEALPHSIGAAHSSAFLVYDGVEEKKVEGGAISLYRVLIWRYVHDVLVYFAMII